MNPIRLFALLTLLLMVGCDGGLTPPEEPPLGAIRVRVTYSDPWPSADSLHDLRFVALKFVPRDTADLLQLTGLVFSEKLPYHTSADTILLTDIREGTFVYSGIALRYAPNPLAWKPVGLYEGADGIFSVRGGDTTDLSVRVSFGNPPHFPPR